MSSERSSTAATSPNIFVTRSRRTSISFGTRAPLLDPRPDAARRGGGHHHLSLRDSGTRGFGDASSTTCTERTRGADRAPLNPTSPDAEAADAASRARSGGSSPLRRQRSSAGKRRHEEEGEGRRAGQADRRAAVDQPDRERARADQRAPQVHQQHGAAVAVPDVHQPMVDVLLVGVADALPRHVRRTIASTTSRNGMNSTSSGTSSTPAIAAMSPPLGGNGLRPTPSIVAIDEQHAEQQRAGVAHEDLRGIEVPRQEPEAHARR